MPDGGAPILLAMPHLAYGGAELVASRIAADLRARGHRVAVAVLSHKPEEQDAAADWFAPVATVLRAAPAAPVAESLARFVAATGAGVVVALGRSDGYAALPALRGRFPDLRLVGFQFNEVELTREHRRYALFLDLIVVEGPIVARALLAQGVPEERVAIIPSGADLARFARRRRRWPRLGAPRVGFVGRIDPVKGPLAFVAMCAALRRRRLRFVMAGDGPFAGEARAAIEAAGLGGRIDWRGRLPREALPALYRALDIVVAPSLSDGRPLVIQEAQAAGAVVIASRVGSIPTLIEHGVTGLLCPPGDVAALAAAVEWLLAEPGRRARIGEAGRRAVLAGGGLAASLAGYRRAILG